MLTTPQGVLSRYFYGIEYSARDLRLGLMESAESRIGTPAQQLLLYCYQYDPANWYVWRTHKANTANHRRAYRAWNSGNDTFPQATQPGAQRLKTGGATQ